jgi:predicted acetyltransferase
MLQKAAAMGIGRVLVTCDAGNAASIGVIEKCGGRLDSQSHSPRARRVTRRYWIDLLPAGERTR